MKTVVIVINTAWNIYNFRLNLARTLKKEGYNVVCVAPYDAVYSPKIEQEFSFYPVAFDAKGMNPFKDIVTMVSLWRLYRKIKPDIVLNYTIKPNLYSTYVAKLLGIQSIVNISGLGTLFIKPSVITTVAHVLYKIALCFTCKVFFQNQDDLHLFLEKGLVSQAKCTLIPGSGVDTHSFFPRDGRDDDGTLRFVLVARMLKDKGVVEFVEAFHLLRQKYSYVQAYLLGSIGIENPTAITQEEMDSFMEEKGVVYLGSSDSVADIIATMDCVVLPSYREGIPRSLLEAAAMEKPIITTNVVGCKEVVEDGINGFLCEAKSVDSLHCAMEKMVLLPQIKRVEMGKEGRKKIVQTFDEVFVIDHYRDAIKEALNSF
ncbi:MAG: glycosyl transferase [Sulfurovum sp. FS06-10]|nr:MAG: glycosyl transferase [Sulfurovum sp. FS06-10]